MPAERKTASYAPKLILHASPGNARSLVAFVEACLRDRVALICIVGDDCARVEDLIDELIVGDGSDDSRFITTTSHPGATIDMVRRFAEAWALDRPADERIEEIKLPCD